MMINEDDSLLITLYQPQEKLSGTQDVIQTSDFTFQLIANDPLNEELSYGTIIEVEQEKNSEGDFVLKQIIKKSDYNQTSFFLPGALNETELRSIGDLVMKEKGYWEVVFGGMAFVNLPKESTLDVFEELNKMIQDKNKSDNQPKVNTQKSQEQFFLEFSKVLNYKGQHPKIVGGLLLYGLGTIFLTGGIMLFHFIKN